MSRVHQLYETGINFYHKFIFSAFYPLPYKFSYWGKRLNIKHKVKTVLFYPEIPQRYSVAYKIMHHLGYKMTNDLKKKADLAIHFEDTTFRKRKPALEKLAKKQKVINLNSVDISKENVEKEFKKVFKYGIFINPLTYKGKYIRKSNVNYAHDGTIFSTPQNKKKGYVYQILINNQHKNVFKDIRTPIINGTIPFVYYKFKSKDNRFGRINVNVDAYMVKTEKAFSKDEKAKVVRFCKNIGLDWGELDVLRDRNTNKIYIVDVNNTPSGPPQNMRKGEYKKAIKTLADIIKLNYFNSPTSN